MAIKYELTEQVGPESLRDGHNGTGVDIPTKRFVTGYQDAISLPAATTDPILGVTRGTGSVVTSPAIKDGQNGSVAIRGKVIVTAGVGGVTKGTRVMAEAATGKAIAWTTGKSIGGIAMTDAIADADAEVELTGPGATAQ